MAPQGSGSGELLRADSEELAQSVAYFEQRPGLVCIGDPRIEDREQESRIGLAGCDEPSAGLERTPESLGKAGRGTRALAQASRELERLLVAYRNAAQPDHQPILANTCSRGSLTRRPRLKLRLPPTEVVRQRFRL